MNLFHFNLFQVNAAKSAAAVAIVGAMYMQPYRPLIVVGHSMEPTYHTGELQWTETVQSDDLKRGDVVVIQMQDGPIVKRIAYLPGDLIQEVKAGKSWIDLVDVQPITNRSLTKDSHYRETHVPEGMVYVLGDNASVSYDSRMFGCIPIDRVERKLTIQRERIDSVDSSL